MLLQSLTKFWRLLIVDCFTPLLCYTTNVTIPESWLDFILRGVLDGEELGLNLIDGYNNAMWAVVTILVCKPVNKQQRL